MDMGCPDTMAENPSPAWCSQRPGSCGILVANPPSLRGLDPAGLSCGPPGALCGISVAGGCSNGLAGLFWVWERQSPLQLGIQISLPWNILHAV